MKTSSHKLLMIIIHKIFQKNKHWIKAKRILATFLWLNRNASYISYIECGYKLNSKNEIRYVKEAI